VHARFIFSVYTLITFFLFISNDISSFYAVSSESTNTHNFSSGITRSIWEKYILSKWKIFYSSRNILAIKRSPSFFRIPSSQISPSLTIYIWTSARELVSFWLVPYRKERKKEKTRATRAVRITFILSFSSLSARFTALCKYNEMASYCATGNGRYLFIAMLVFNGQRNIQGVAPYLLLAIRFPQKTPSQ